jgi:hypothetical protein
MKALCRAGAPSMLVLSSYSWIIRTTVLVLLFLGFISGVLIPMVQAQTTASLWTTSTTPRSTNSSDTNSVELGVKFVSSVDGAISAIRFYKGSQNTGQHTVSLWTSLGTKLANTTSSNETASGWQTVPLSAPVSITAGTTYVASYHTSGRYSYNLNYFRATYRNGPLAAPANAGVYAYGTGSIFPNSSWQASNYWVDILFRPSTATVNGACGGANGVTVTSAPATNLCTTGTASIVTGIGPWTWTCIGSNGGGTTSCSASSASSTADSLLLSDRDASMNWQMAGMLSVGGIPNRIAVCATISPLGNGRDDTPNIQTAINSCPLSQVVSLGAGIFTIAEGSYLLLNKGITLRGAGPGATILQRTNGARLGSYQPGSSPSPMIIVGPMRWNNDATPTPLTGDAVQGTNSVQVASTTGFSVGQIVLLDETSGAGWQTDPQGRGKIWASPDFRVVWQKHNPPQPGDDFDANTYPYTPGGAGCWFSNCDRPTNEIKRISAISENTITFDSPIMISYRVSHHAQLLRWLTPFTTNAGVENMTVSYGDDGNIEFTWCAYCWARNVESSLWLGAGFKINFSFRVQLERVYAHNPVWPVPGGGGYNISLAWGASEILIENSISVLANKVMVVRSSGAGSVVAYNYMDNGFISRQENWQEIGLNGSHMVGSHHMLFEGNYAFNIDSDKTHGNSIYHTFFRNYASGYRRPFTNTLSGTVVDDLNNRPGGNGPFRAVGAMAYSYWMSYIGNVLGTPGHTNGWVYDSGYMGTPGIFMLGWDDSRPYPTDSNVAATAIRDSNYDYLTNRVHWDARDPNHTLPDSLYLTQKPAFFNAASGNTVSTWPWINPIGSQQLYTLPAKARYDAGTPFTQP